MRPMPKPFAVRRPDTVDSRDATLVADGRAIQLRRFTPAGTPHGLLLYAHGGGFMLGSLDSHDGIVARVADETGAVVIAIDYRLAPEHPVPAALADVLAVLAAATVGRLPWPDLPRSGLMLMGDSAGATLMASAALAVGHTRPDALAGLALIYPALGYEPAEPARSEEARAPMLTLDDVLFYRTVYLAGQITSPRHLHSRRARPASVFRRRSFCPPSMIPCATIAALWPSGCGARGRTCGSNRETASSMDSFAQSTERLQPPRPSHGFAAPWPGAWRPSPV